MQKRQTAARVAGAIAIGLLSWALPIAQADAPPAVSSQTPEPAQASALSAPLGSGTATLNGHVNWMDYAGSNWLMPVGVQFVQSNVVRRTERVFLDASNNFSISGIDAGTYNLVFSAAGCLREVVSGVAFGTTPVAVTVSLQNGDLNGDNAIGLADLSILSASYGKSAQ